MHALDFDAEMIVFDLDSYQVQEGSWAVIMVTFDPTIIHAA